MPRFTLQDSQTGRTLTVDGDAPPIQEDAHQLFGSFSPSIPPPNQFLTPGETGSTEMSLDPQKQADLSIMNLTPEQTANINRQALNRFTEAAFTPLAPVGKYLGVSGQQFADAGDVLKGSADAVSAFIHGQDPKAAYLATAGQRQREPSTAEKIAAGTQQAIVDSLDFFTSPVGIATLGTGALPKAAQRAVSLAFATQMAHSAPDQFQQFLEAHYAGDKEGMAKGAVGMGLTGAFILGSAGHAVKGITAGKPTVAPKTEAALPQAALTEPGAQFIPSEVPAPQATEPILGPSEPLPAPSAESKNIAAPVEAPTGAALLPVEAAAPEVAELGKSGNKDTFGNPRGTKYHATQADWSEWQAIKQMPGMITDPATGEPAFNDAKTKAITDLQRKYAGTTPEPPKAAAAPAEVVKPPMTSEELQAQMAKLQAEHPPTPRMTPEETDAAIARMLEDPNTSRTGANPGYDIGHNVTTIDQLNTLLSGVEKYRTSQAAVGGQFFREAIERATKSGSAGEGPYEAALDYRKNPEIAQWLLDNAERIGFTPESVLQIRHAVVKQGRKAPTPSAGESPQRFTVAQNEAGNWEVTDTKKGEVVSIAPNHTIAETMRATMEEAFGQPSVAGQPLKPTEQSTTGNQNALQIEKPRTLPVQPAPGGGETLATEVRPAEKPAGPRPETPKTEAPATQQHVLISTKEPWQMTGAEYVATKVKETGTKIQKYLDAFAADHKLYVRQALEEGKTVSPEVLKDYSDLKAPAEAKAGSVAKSSPAPEQFTLLEVDRNKPADAQIIQLRRLLAQSQRGINDERTKGIEARLRQLEGRKLKATGAASPQPPPTPEQLSGMRRATAMGVTPPPSPQTKVLGESNVNTTADAQTASRRGFSTKAAKEQKKFLLDAVDQAMAEAPEGVVEPGQLNRSAPGNIGYDEASAATAKANQEIHARNVAKFGTVTIQVPGDGDFTILNTKSALADFKERAQKFPTSSPKPKQPSNGRTTPTAAASLGTVDKASALKALAPVTAADPERFVIYQKMWSDGQVSVATNGRMMTLIRTGLGGTKKKPIVVDLNGKPVDLGKDVKYPDWTQVVPKDFKESMKNVDTEKLFVLLKQAEQMTSERAKSVTLWRNADGSLGITSKTPELGEYEHNVPDRATAKVIAALDPKYLSEAINAARRVGDKTVTLQWTNELTPLVIESKNAKSVIMPMRLSSIGAPVARPISLEAGQAAVLETLRGKAPNVRFINDPAADAGNVTYRPSALPEITINLARHETPAQVRDTLLEELLHPVMADPKNAGLVARMEALVDQAAMERQAREGYLPDQQLDEAANEIARELFTSHADAGFFRRGMNQIALAVKRIFGLELTDEQVALHLANRALKNQRAAATGQAAAREPYKSAEEVKREAEAIGVPPDAAEAIRQRAGQQVALYSPAARSRVQAVAAASRVAARHLGRVLEAMDIPGTETPLASLPPEQRLAAGQLRLAQHFLNLDEAAKVASAETQALAAMEKFSNKMERLNTARMRADLLETVRDQLPKAYIAYLENVIASSRPGELASVTAQRLLNRIKTEDGRFVVGPASIERAIMEIVDNPAIRIEASTTPEDITKQVLDLGGLRSVGEQPNLALLGNIEGLKPVLHGIADLPETIMALRDLQGDATAAKAAMQQFQDWFKKSGTKVSPYEALIRYGKVSKELQTARLFLKKTDAEWSKAEANVEGVLAARAAMAEVIGSPEYAASVDEAARAVGANLTGIETQQGAMQQVRSPLDLSKTFTFWNMPSKDQIAVNRENALELMREIQAFGETTTDPVQKVTYDMIGRNVSRLWLETVADPVESAAEVLNVMGRGPSWLDTILNMFERIGGRLTLGARRNANALASMTARLRNVADHPEYGVFKLTTLAAEAAAGHGFNPKDPHEMAQYERLIANPLLASWQRYGSIPLAAGDYVPFTSYKVSEADVSRALAQRRHEQAIRKLAEHDLEVYGLSTRIERESGTTNYRTLSVAEGPQTTTRHYYDWITDWLGTPGNWSVGAVGEQRAAQVSNLMRLIESDPQRFRDLVLGYVAESSPEFKRSSQFNDAYRKLTLQAKHEPLTITDIDDLATRLSAIIDTPIDAAEFRRALTNEIAGYMESFAKKAGEIRELEGPDVNQVQRILIQSLKTEGSFIKPRGTMLAPSTFYQYAKIAGADLLKVSSMAHNIGRERVLETMYRIQDGLVRERARLQAELQAAIASGEPGSRAEKLASMAAQRKRGDIRFTLPELETWIDGFNREIAKAEAEINANEKDLTLGMAQILGIANKNLLAQLLGSFKSIINNLTGGLLTNDAIFQAHVGGLLNVFTSAFKMTGKTVNALMGKAAARLERAVPSLSPVIRNTLPLLGYFGRQIERNGEMIRRLTDEGIIGLDNRGDISAAKKAVGFGGTILTEGETPGMLLRASQWLNTSRLLMWQQAWFPRKGDEFINLTQGQRAREVLLDAASWAKRIGDTRTENGAKMGQLNERDPAQSIQPAEMKLSSSQLYWLRTYLEPVGGLESILFDYYRRLKTSDRPSDVPVVTDRQMQAIILSLGMKGNIVRSVNSPASFRGSVARTIAGSLGNYPANMIAQALKLLPARLDQASTMKVLTLLSVLGLAAIYGTMVKEVGTGGMEFITGKSSAQPRLANLLDNPTGADTAAYLVSALTTQIPYLNLATDRMFGTGSSRSLFDLANVVPFAGFVKDAGSSLLTMAQTGDAVTPGMSLLNRYMPLYSGVANRIPGLEGDLAGRNTLRSLRAATPHGIEMRDVSGGGISNPTPLSRLMSEAERAAYRGDNASAKAAIDKAVDLKMVQKGLTREKALVEVRSSIAARSPEARTYGRTLAPTERDQILGRMTGRQRSDYQRGQSAYGSLLSLAGGRGVRRGSGTRTARGGRGRRLRSIRPPGLASGIRGYRSLLAA